MKTWIKWMIAKIILIGILLGLLLYAKRDSTSVSIVIAMLTTFIVILFLRIKNPDKYKTDERLNKLYSRAVAWSWQITLLIVLFIFWFNYLELFVFTVDAIINTVFLTMIISLVIFRYFFMRKADIK